MQVFFGQSVLYIGRALHLTEILGRTLIISGNLSRGIVSWYYVLTRLALFQSSFSDYFYLGSYIESISDADTEYYEDDQRLYYFHFHFRYVTLFIYIYIYNMRSYAYPLQ